MPAHRFALPALIAVCAVCTTGAGLWSSAELRAEERRDRAAAAEQRALQAEREAVRAYQGVLTPVAVAVYDTVQPLQQSYADLADGDVSAVDVLVDVSNHVVDEQGLPSLIARLDALTPAASVEDEHEALGAALRDMVAAARPVAALMRSKDARIDGEIIADGDLALDDATRDWVRPITPVFEGGTAPPVPVESGDDGRRRPVSHASYLRDVGTLCSVGIDRLVELGNNKADPSTEEIRGGLRELTERVPQLKAVKTAAEDEQRVASSIRDPLERSLELLPGFNKAMAAAGRGDPAGVLAGQAQIARGEVAAEKAAAGFRAYGSQVCGVYLVGLEEADAGGGADASTRTA